MFVVRMREYCGSETLPDTGGRRYVAVGERIKGDERDKSQGVTEALSPGRGNDKGVRGERN